MKLLKPRENLIISGSPPLPNLKFTIQGKYTFSFYVILEPNCPFYNSVQETVMSRKEKIHSTLILLLSCTIESPGLGIKTPTTSASTPRSGLIPGLIWELASLSLLTSPVGKYSPIQESKYIRIFETSWVLAFSCSMPMKRVLFYIYHNNYIYFF